MRSCSSAAFFSFAVNEADACFFWLSRPASARSWPPISSRNEASCFSKAFDSESFAARSSRAFEMFESRAASSDLAESVFCCSSASDAASFATTGSSEPMRSCISEAVFSRTCASAPASCARRCKSARLFSKPAVSSRSAAFRFSRSLDSLSRAAIESCAAAIWVSREASSAFKVSLFRRWSVSDATRPSTTGSRAAAFAWRSFQEVSC